MTVILFTGVGLSADIPTAEALKGKGVGLAKTGSASGICGLVLCSEYPGGKTAYDEDWVLAYMTEVQDSSNKHDIEHEERPIMAHAANVDQVFPAQLDHFIHKFELGKISTEEALEGIYKVYYTYDDAGINNELISSVEKKIQIYEGGKLSPEQFIESVHLTAEPQNINPEYQGALDEIIHKFELDKIPAKDAIEQIKQVHEGFTGLYITSDIIESVNEKIALIDSDELTGADAVESIHLTAEPQNVNPEYQGVLDDVLHKYKLDDMSSDDALAEIIKIHEGFTGLYITSDMIEDVGKQITIYEFGNVSSEHTLDEIHKILEKAELAAISDGIPVIKELPPNHVDMPAGSAVPGCEVDNWCYLPGEIWVNVGDTVTWVNSDALPHTATSGSADSDAIGVDAPNGFDSGFISGGDEWSHTFDVKGEYYYYCQLHPWMEGTVTVQ